MNPPYDFDVIIVGTGPGGCAAALEAAQMGRRVAAIDLWPPKDTLGLSYLGALSMMPKPWGGRVAVRCSTLQVRSSL